MLDQWVALVDERFHGQKLASRTPSLERTVRNLARGRYGESRFTPEKLTQAAIRDHGGGRPDDAFATKLRGCVLAALEAPGLVTALFMGEICGVRDRSEMLRFAGGLDRLSASIAEAQGRRDVVGLKGALRSASCLADPYWVGLRRRDLRQDLAEANEPSATGAVLAQLAYNAMLSTLAIWDVCLHRDAFPRFQARPLFLLVAPRVKPGLPRSSGADRTEVFAAPARNRGLRDFVDTPLSLFVEVVACLSSFRRDGGRFPADRPTLGEMASLFGVEAKELDRLRGGTKRLTAHTLNGLVPAFPPTALLPLLWAAHTWEGLLVRRSPKGEAAGAGTRRASRAIVPDGDYLRFWSMHREELQARGSAAAGGDIRWPGYLSRR